MDYAYKSQLDLLSQNLRQHFVAILFDCGPLRIVVRLAMEPPLKRQTEDIEAV